ncbi:putative serine esterase [Cryptosporidium felis]|nr:putative serine esterase [Cryptosporidium felis]
MSLFATVSFAISFGKFRNIDLLQSGYYRLRSRLYFMNDSETYTAIPKNIIYSKHQKTELKWEAIQDDGSTLSRPFQINYIDDVADLSETIIFSSDVKLQVPTSKPFSSFFVDAISGNSNEAFQSNFSNGNLSIAPFFLEVDLLHSDISEPILLPESPISEDFQSEESEICFPTTDEFKSLCYNVYRINNVANGIVEFLPILFDEFHFCHTSCLILSQVTRLFASCDFHYSKRKTTYTPRFYNVKPLPTIPSFLISNNKEKLNTEEYSSEKNETKEKKKEFLSKTINNRNLAGPFTIRGILIQKMSQITTNSQVNMSETNNKEGNETKTLMNEQTTTCSNEDIDETEGNAVNKDNPGIQTEKEINISTHTEGDSSKGENKNSTIDKRGSIGIDEAFPSIITRDPMFLEASRFRLELMTSLTTIYLQLAANMHFITKRCCSPQRARLMGSFLTVPSLKLPGGSKINVEPLINLSEFSYIQNGASVPFIVVREQKDQVVENQISRVSSELQLKEEKEFKHSFTIGSDGNSIGVLPEQRLSDSTMNSLKLPTTIWALTPLNWQLNYTRGITPPVFKRNSTSQVINPNLLISYESISSFQSVVEASFGIPQYCIKLNEEIEDISSQILELWNRLVATLPFVLHRLEQLCRMEHIRKTMYLWNETIFLESLSINELYSPSLKPEPSLNFPEFVGCRSFPITPPMVLSIRSSPSSDKTETEHLKKKNSGFFSIFPIIGSGIGLSSQNSSGFFLKPIEYYSKIADLLRNDTVFKSIPTPNSIEEVCLPPGHENSTSDEQSNTKKKPLELPEDIGAYSLLSLDHLNSSKYNEWLPIIFIQRYSENCDANLSDSLYSKRAIPITDTKAPVSNRGGVIIHCGQLCRLGMNNDPAINARSIINRKIECDKNEFGCNSPTNEESGEKEPQDGSDDAPRIPLIKTEIPFSEETKECSKELHIIIFVHGLQGSAFDMRNVRNIISLYYPDVLCLLSTCNEDYTDGPIEEMGKRLSEEVISAISPFSKSLKKLSFIGHSLGGIIIRAALPHLQMFSSKFFLYWSLSTPHLGCISNDSKLINAGVWIIKKWSSSQSLIQLSLSDSQKYEETFIYKLAMESSLLISEFKHIVLCSSHQDMYAPYDSARAEYSPEAPSIYKVMVENMLKHVNPSKITRVNVDFYLPQRNLDTFIGRAAHIQVIENQLFMKILVSRFPEWFIV